MHPTYAALTPLTDESTDSGSLAVMGHDVAAAMSVFRIHVGEAVQVGEDHRAQRRLSLGGCDEPFQLLVGRLLEPFAALFLPRRPLGRIERLVNGVRRLQFGAKGEVQPGGVG